MRQPDWLSRIDPAATDYSTWLEVGMSLKKEGFSVEAWDEWSKKDPGRYHDGECRKKWNTFSSDGSGVGPGTAIMHARNAGNYSEGNSFDWDDEIQVVDEAFIESEDHPAFGGGGDWDPVDEMKRFLRAAFHDGDHVGYVLDSYDAGTGKKRPVGGYYDRTAEEILADLERYNDIPSALGAMDEEGGAWVVVNPIDGQGRKDANVTDYRHMLIESDDDDLGKQLAIIRELNLPCRSIVFSGARSIHAQVRVDAANEAEYRERVHIVLAECKKAGLHVDEANKNASRMMRLPGVMRNGKRQALIDVDCGAESWYEWVEWLADERDDLPPTLNLGKEWGNLPSLAPELIGGLLRKGHKGLIAGPSKMGKTFLLMSLVIAVAEGTSWLGHPCQQGRVLYINMEVDPASCLHRFEDIYTAMHLPANGIGNIDVLNLRGRVKPLSKLASQIVHRARKRGPDPEHGGYSLIIIDPLYKVLTGDENSASDMAEFCNFIDMLCAELGCSVIYAHHHSKGKQGFKSSIDRMSGSGVFARDPDAILDFSPLVADEDQRYAGFQQAIGTIIADYLDVKAIKPPVQSASMPDLEEWAYGHLNADEEAELRELVEEYVSTRPLPTTWRGSFTLREFPSPEPVDVWFSHPLHTVDDWGILADCAIEGEPRRGKASREDAETKASDRRTKIEEAFDMVSMGQNNASITDLADYMGCSAKTVHRRLDEHGGFTRKGGVAWRS